MKRLLIGPAAVGKTRRALDIFRQQILSSENAGLDFQAFFVLPNQEHAGRIHALLLRDPAFSGIMNHHVMAVNDFARYVAGSANRRAITQFERQWVIRGVLGRQPWKWLEGVKESPGVPDMLAHWVRDVKSSGKSSEEVEKLWGGLAEAGLCEHGKAEDLQKLLRLYDRRRQELGLEDSENEMWDVSRAWKNEPASLRLDLVIFDGFFSFTPAQRAFVDALGYVCQELIVTLTADADPQRKEAFYYPLKTRDFLTQAGFVEERMEGAQPRFASETLMQLEKSLFSSEKRIVASTKFTDPVPSCLQEPGPVSIKAKEVITLLATGSPSQEFDMIAREILAHVRAGKYHFSDHMLVLRNVLGAREKFERAFDRYGVPYEVHERKRLSEHPAIRKVLDWAEIPVREESGVWRYDVDAAVKYAKHEATAALWNERYAIEKLLNEAGDPHLREDDKAATEFSPAMRFAKDIRESVRRYSELKSSEAWAAFFLALYPVQEPDIVESPDDVRCREIYEDAVAAHAIRIKGGELSPHDAALRLRDELEMGLYSISFPNKNRVQVYDVVLAMPKEYKVVFVASLVEDQFPAAQREDALVKPEEREWLNARGMDWPLLAHLQSGERYFFYMAVTRAAEKLYLSYPRFDADGKTVLRSSFIDEALACVGEHIRIVEKSPAELVPLPEEARQIPDVLKLYGACRAEETAMVIERTLEEFLKSHGVNVGMLKESMHRTKLPVMLKDAQTADAYSAKNQIFSASQLSVLKNCAYQHFARYGVGIKSPDEESPVMKEGKFMHLWLENVHRHWFGKGEEKLPPEAAWSKEGMRIFDETLAGWDGFGAERAYRSGLRSQRLAELATFVLAEEYEDLKHRKTFWPRHMEFGFGPAGDGAGNADAIEIRTGGKSLWLKGRIDRVDVDSETSRALVIDYKLSSGFSFSDFEKGLSPQALVYVLALQKIWGYRPIGAEFVALKTMKRNGFLIKEAYDEIRPDHALKNTLDEQAFEEKIDDLLSKIHEDIIAMRSGRIEARSETCRNCEYPGMCRYEGWKQKSQ